MLVENGFEIEVFRGRALGDIWWAKALLVLVSPILCCLGWDICRTQMLFRVRKGRVLGQRRYRGLDRPSTKEEGWTFARTWRRW